MEPEERANCLPSSIFEIGVGSFFTNKRQDLAKLMYALLNHNVYLTFSIILEIIDFLKIINGH